MSYRLDKIDRRIIHALMTDARNTSAPMIAEDLNASPGTIRNRINRLEEHEIIKGYTATVDFERADGRLTSLYMCTVPAAERERLALEVQSIPGVINVRVLMAGRRDLHVVAVGEDTKDLRRIARALSELDVEIEDEELVQTEIRSPYAPFGPDEAARSRKATDLISLPGDSEIVEVAISQNAPIVGRTIDEARERGILQERAVVISIERDGEMMTPTGDTTFNPDDVVLLLPRDGPSDDVMVAFLGSDADDR
ncbi:MAG: TrkA C-terminal domain-containing protein [Halobacteriota archaeon]